MGKIIFSLLTFGWHMNNTINNQGDHCIVAHCNDSLKLIGVDSNQMLLTDDDEKQCTRNKAEIIEKLNAYAVLLFNSAK